MSVSNKIMAYYDWLVAQSIDIDLNLNLKAVPKGRPRFSTKSGRAYTPEKTREFEEAVKAVAKTKIPRPLSYPVSVIVIVTEAVPVSYSKLDKELCLLNMIVPQRGDLDNKVKAITDALNGVAFHDDSQIASIHATKSYGEKDNITVSIRRNGLSSMEADLIKKRVKASHVNDIGRSSDLGETRDSGVSVRPEQGTTH